MAYPYNNPVADFAHRMKPLSELSQTDAVTKGFDPNFSSSMPAVCGIDLDAVAQKDFAKYSKLPLRSCDALFMDEDGMYYLVEFKNQASGNIKKEEIHKKIIDSLSLILYVFSPSDSIETLHSRVKVYVVFPDQNAFLKIAKTIATSGSSSCAMPLERPLWELSHLVENGFVSFVDTMTLTDFKREIGSWPLMKLPQL